MTTKVITMTLEEGNSTVSIREVFDDAASWMAIAYMFAKFLKAQGYELDHEAVGADVDSYVASQSEEEQW